MLGLAARASVPAFGHSRGPIPLRPSARVSLSQKTGSSSPSLTTTWKLVMSPAVALLAETRECSGYPERRGMGHPFAFIWP